MFWEGALPRKFANFKVQNEECHYYASTQEDMMMSLDDLSSSSTIELSSSERINKKKSLMCSIRQQTWCSTIQQNKKKNIITHLKPCRVQKESGAHHSTPNHTSLQTNKKHTWSMSSKTNKKKKCLLSCVKPKIEDKKY
jgi:hypothetical protein